MLFYFSKGLFRVTRELKNPVWWELFFIVDFCWWYFLISINSIKSFWSLEVRQNIRSHTFAYTYVCVCVCMRMWVREKKRTNCLCIIIRGTLYTAAKSNIDLIHNLNLCENIELIKRFQTACFVHVSKGRKSVFFVSVHRSLRCTNDFPSLPRFYIWN